jgi:hypothetical protein
VSDHRSVNHFGWVLKQVLDCEPAMNKRNQR